METVRIRANGFVKARRLKKQVTSVLTILLSDDRLISLNN